jgi:hypothetical protein
MAHRTKPNSMKEQLITFETAKLAKEKGFDIPCKKRYLSDQYKVYSLANNRGLQIIGIQAPTQSLLQKWLRDKFKMDVQPICTYKTFRFYHLGIIFINDKNQIDTILIKDEGMQTNKLFNSYEEALEEGLFETLKLIP